MTGDRSLMSFRDNMLVFIGYVCDSGFSDLPQLARYIQGMRGEINLLEDKACAIAGEQADRIAREERETAIPPCAS